MNADTILVGLTIPKLLPITGSFVLPLSAYYLYLQTRVVYIRLTTETYMGHDCSEKTSATNAVSSSESQDTDPLYAVSRAQMNFAENVPLALLLAGIVELNGGSRKALTYTLSALTVLRVLHAELGVMSKNNVGIGRIPGYYGTQAVIAGLAGYAGYLVKGYWGY